MIFGLVIGTLFGGLVGYLIAAPEFTGENTCVCRECRLSRELPDADRA